MQAMMMIFAVSMVVLYIGLSFVVYVHHKLLKVNSELWIEHYAHQHGINVDQVIKEKYETHDQI